MRPVEKTVNASHWTRHRNHMSALRYYKTVKPKPSGVESALRSIGLLRGPRKKGTP